MLLIVVELRKRHGYAPNGAAQAGHVRWRLTALDRTLQSLRRHIWSRRTARTRRARAYVSSRQLEYRQRWIQQIGSLSVSDENCGLAKGCLVSQLGNAVVQRKYQAADTMALVSECRPLTFF